MEAVHRHCRRRHSSSRGLDPALLPASAMQVGVLAPGAAERLGGSHAGGPGARPLPAQPARAGLLGGRRDSLNSPSCKPGITHLRRQFQSSAVQQQFR